MEKYLRLVVAVVLVIAIILSVTLLGNRFTDPATYSHSIEVLDDNKATVMGLAASSAAASTAVSLLKGDVGSAISDELSEFATWFTVILAVIYLEKYLLTIFGAASCYILFPVGLGVLLVNCFLKRDNLKTMGTRLVTFGVVLLLIVPTSVWVSDHIHETYSQSIEMTIQSANTASEELIAAEANETEEKASVFGEVKSFVSNVGSSVANAAEGFKNLVNRFIEATAVMLVTTCLIPILVVLFLIWVMKTLFNVPIVGPPQLLPPKRHKKRLTDNEDERELALIR